MEEYINLFLIVIHGGNKRFDAHAKAMIAIFSEMFGSSFLDNCMLVFTHWSQGK